VVRAQSGGLAVLTNGVPQTLGSSNFLNAPLLRWACRRWRTVVGTIYDGFFYWNNGLLRRWGDKERVAGPRVGALVEDRQRGSGSVTTTKDSAF